MKMSKILLVTTLSTSLLAIPVSNFQEVNIARAATDAEYEGVYNESVKEVNGIYKKAVSEWKISIEKSINEPLGGGKGASATPLWKISNEIYENYNNKIMQLSGSDFQNNEQYSKFYMKFHNYLSSLEEKAQSEAEHELGVTWDVEKGGYIKSTSSNKNSAQREQENRKINGVQNNKSSKKIGTIEKNTKILPKTAAVK